MRIVVLNNFLPCPANSGGRLRNLAIVRRLASRGQVTLYALDDGVSQTGPLEDLGVEVRLRPRPAGRLALAAGVVTARSVSAGRCYNPDLVRQVREDARRRRPDVLVAEASQLFPWAKGVPARLRLLDLHNVESDLVESYARARGPLAGLPFRLEAAALRRLERAALADFDVVSVASDLDRRRLPAPGRKVVVCPNGWDAEPPLPAAGKPVAAFVALMGWPPNVDAATWLVREVWPQVVERVPDAGLLLVGRDPTPAVEALRSRSVEVTGTVADTTPYLAAAQVCLAPLRAGGGSRLKLLEALSAGRPVVSTPIGAEGLDELVGSGVVLAEGSAAFAHAIVDLFSDPERARRLGLAGHHVVAGHHSWDQTLRPLLDAVDEIARKP